MHYDIMRVGVDNMDEKNIALLIDIENISPYSINVEVVVSLSKIFEKRRIMFR